MDKAEVIKRLDALDVEAKELRKIIERGDGLQYNHKMLYVAKISNMPYILFGGDSYGYFRWHSLENHPGEQGWSSPDKTGQKAIDHALRDGTVREFANPMEGLKYFMSIYKG